MSRRCLLGFLAWLVWWSPWSSNCGGEDRLAGMDIYIAVAMAEWQVPGLALAVIQGDDVALMRTYGLADVTTKRRIDEETLFPIASCTKSFTAASVALLVEERRWHWDDLVVTHFPGFRLADRQAARQLTLRDLLCHRTGLDSGDFLLMRGDVGREELIARTALLPLRSPIRTKDSYNNLMYVLLGELVARKADQPWETFVTARLLEPLHMNATCFDPPDVDRVALRHWQQDGRVEVRPHIPGIAADAASAGLYSSVHDMANWVRFQLGDGRFQGQRILARTSLREMQAMHTSIPVRGRQPDSSYAPRFHGAGLGWYTWDYRGKRLIVHSGSWGAVVALLPEEDLGVVILSNLDWNGLVEMLMYRLLDAYTLTGGVVWDTANFSEFRAGGRGAAYLQRDRDLRRLELERVTGSKPSLPLDRYAGTYSSPLYGDLQVIADEAGGLILEVGPFRSRMEHWHRNSFYVRSPTELNFDWLMEFTVAQQSVQRTTIRYVGWQRPDMIFERAAE